MFKSSRLCLLLSFSSFSLWAQDINFSQRFNWYNRAIYRDVVDSFANPNNQVGKIPSRVFETDLRPSFTWDKGNHTVRIDPRFIGTYNSIEVNDDLREKTEGELFVNEAFYQLNYDDHQLVLGFQNYQWGPAEMLSPTNPIFRFLFDQRSLFFQQRGRNLIRWNWSISEKVSLVSMIEVTKNSSDLPVEDQRFSQNGLIKIESTMDKASDYLGLIVGKTPYQENFIGEYGAYQLTEEYSFYFDIRHQENTNSYYPARASTDLFQKNAPERIYTLGTVGLRYESRLDIRLEYIFNEIGFTEDQYEKAQTALSTLSPNLSENYRRYHLSGRDLNKQHYGYLSIRMPDVGPKDEYTFFLRYFNSLQDQSSLYQFQMDRLTGDNFNLYLEAAAYRGEKNKDFSSLISNEVSLGLRYSY